MSNTARARRKLETRLEKLKARLEEIDETLRQPEEQDSQERAGDWDEDEVMDRLASSIREEIGLIRNALKRIDKGHYGICEACSRPIDPRRLHVLPQATMCARCAHKAA
jgi:RNA polymerase-binding transcription factor DksA